MEMTEEREKFLSESRKYSEERCDILAYTEGKLEETNQALQEFNNERCVYVCVCVLPRS